MITEAKRPDGPLRGLKVLDTSTMYASPMVATLLADHGADVIKVEPPGGDPYRAHPAMWTVVARNKGSIVLDLKSDGDCDRLRRMIPYIDVIVVNMPPALLKRRGLDYETLSALNPGLIMAHFSGYGLTGPYAARAGNGTVSEAFAGYTNMTGAADGPPVMASVPLGDGLAAFSGAFGVMAACYQRMSNGGRGALIDVNPIDAVLQVTGIVLAGYDGKGEPPRRMGNRVAGPNLRDVFETRDGKWITYALSTPRQWTDIAALTGHVLEDPARFDPADLAKLAVSVRDWTRARTRDAAMKELLARSMMVAPVNDARDLLADEHIRARHSLLYVESPEGARTLTPAPAPHFIGTDAPTLMHTPALGADDSRLPARRTKSG